MPSAPVQTQTHSHQPPAPAQPASASLVPVERYNKLLLRLEAEVRVREQVEAHLNAARSRVDFLERQLAHYTSLFPANYAHPHSHPYPHLGYALPAAHNNPNVTNSTHPQPPQVSQQRPAEQDQQQSQGQPQPPLQPQPQQPLHLHHQKPELQLNKQKPEPLVQSATPMDMKPEPSVQATAAQGNDSVDRTTLLNNNNNKNNSSAAQPREILSHCSDISNFKGTVNGVVDGGGHISEADANDANIRSKKSVADTAVGTLKKVGKEKKSGGGGVSGGAVGKKTKAKKERPAKVKIPGQSRYWTPEEHKLFLEALQKYGHKDLRSISAYVGTRNMTQVRTHSQKYFMRLMREAKRQNPTLRPMDSCSENNSCNNSTMMKHNNDSLSNSNNNCNKTCNNMNNNNNNNNNIHNNESNCSTTTTTTSRAMRTTATTATTSTNNPTNSCGDDDNNNNCNNNLNNNSKKHGLVHKRGVDDSDKYSVPNTCGMTLLCLVGEDTRV